MAFEDNGIRPEGRQDYREIMEESRYYRYYGDNGRQDITEIRDILRRWKTGF